MFPVGAHSSDVRNPSSFIFTPTTLTNEVVLRLTCPLSLAEPHVYNRVIFFDKSEIWGIPLKVIIALAFATQQVF